MSKCNPSISEAAIRFDRGLADEYEIVKVCLFQTASAVGEYVVFVSILYLPAYILDVPVRVYR